MKALILFQTLLHLFIGLGAIGGGACLMYDPSGKLIGLPIGYLQGSPFGSYLVPGIVLFILIGIGNLVAAVLGFKNHRHSGELGNKLGAILLIWMAVQLLVIGYKMWIQMIFIAISIVQFMVGFAIIYKIKK